MWTRGIEFRDGVEGFLLVPSIAWQMPSLGGADLRQHEPVPTDRARWLVRRLFQSDPRAVTHLKQLYREASIVAVTPASNAHLLALILRELAWRWEPGDFGRRLILLRKKEKRVGHTPVNVHAVPVQAPPPTDSREVQDFVIRLVGDEEQPLPEVKYVVTFHEGTRLNGTLDAEGRAEIRDAPAGWFTVRYPDQDEVHAKNMAARLQKGIAEQDPTRILTALNQAPARLQATARAWERHFNTAGAATLEEAVSSVLAGEERVAAEHLLAPANLVEASDVEVLAWVEPISQSDDATRLHDGVAYA